MNEQEMAIFQIISASGDSKSKAFEALKQVKSKNYGEAKRLLKEAQEIDIEAHKVQTKLIQNEMNEEVESPAISLLMVHAQDHYMTSQLARDLIETLIEVFEERDK